MTARGADSNRLQAYAGAIANGVASGKLDRRTAAALQALLAKAIGAGGTFEQFATRAAQMGLIGQPRGLLRTVA